MNESDNTIREIVRPVNVTAEYLLQNGLAPNFPERFFKKVNRNGPVSKLHPERGACWLWMGWKKKHGYGCIAKTNQPHSYITAHRASWIIHYGPIPVDLSVLHDCPDEDNTSCVNPIHLWLGTQLDNIEDMVKKGRHRTNPLFGEDHQNSKLTWIQAKAIREKYATGIWSQSMLARENGVTQTTIFCVVNHKTWIEPM